jgi:TolB protein
MTHRHLRYWCALVAASLAWPLAGCGGGDEKAAEPSAAALRPAYSPDGTKIAFTRVTDDGRVVYLMNADGTEQHTVTPLGGDLRDGYESPSFSPDGKRLVVAGDVGGIFVIGTDGSGLKPLVDDEDYEDREPAFSPDGTKIAWLRTTLGSTKQDDGTERVTSEETALWIMEADGSHPRRLAASAGPDQVGPPAFSPDGRRIAYVVENPDAKTLDRHLWVMNADGTGAKALTSGPDNSDWDPSFSPDAHKIVFAGIRGGEILEVYAMDADGTDPTQLTSGRTYSEDPSYSPDGKRILFTSQRSGSREVWVMNADGSDPRQLTTFMPSSAEIS